MTSLTAQSFTAHQCSVRQLHCSPLPHCQNPYSSEFTRRPVYLCGLQLLVHLGGRMKILDLSNLSPFLENKGVEMENTVERWNRKRQRSLCCAVENQRTLPLWVSCITDSLSVVLTDSLRLHPNTPACWAIWPVQECPQKFVGLERKELYCVVIIKIGVYAVALCAFWSFHWVGGSVWASVLSSFEAVIRWMVFQDNCNSGTQIWRRCWLLWYRNCELLWFDVPIIKANAKF